MLRKNDRGHFQLDGTWPPPTPPPVTIIAWRLCHIIGSVLSARNARYFSGIPWDAKTLSWPPPRATR